MGVCQSHLSAEEIKARDQAKGASKAIDQGLRHDQSQDQSINKLLLLGAGESGKSTLFKQMISIYGKGYSADERKDVTVLVYGNIISTMQKLCEACEKVTQFGEVSCPDSLKFVSNIATDEIDEECGTHLKKLWADPVIQKIFASRHNHNIQLHASDSIVYFFDGRIDDIMKSDYVPTPQDHLRTRVPTTGIVKNSFDIDGNSFEMFDVGGQRSERKKWINCFDNVTAVLFVAAISEFDQMLFEEATQNRIIEALNLFEDVTNSPYFERTSIILFLNKRDIFQEKIENGVQLADTFPDFTGNNTVQECSGYLVDLFASKDQNADKDVYTHITCATDTNNVFSVFNAVKDIIIKRGLMRAGLV